MRKRIITFLFCLLVAGFTQAQVIFNPDNYVGLDLPDGMSIEQIDGVNYLKTTLAGWGSSIMVSPTSVILNASSTKIKMKARYDIKSTVPADSLKFFVQVQNTQQPKTVALAATDAAVPTELSTVTTDVLSPKDTAIQLQLAAQYKGGDWHAIEGDVMYLGVVEAFDPSAVADPDVLFDPATFTGTLPADAEIIEDGGVKYLKCPVDGWNTNLTIDPKSTSGFNKFTTTLKFEVGTSGIQTDSANVFIQANKELGQITATGTDILTGYTELTSDLIADSECASIQIAVQNKQGWDAIAGAIVYVGKVTMSYEEPTKVTPPATAVLEYTATAPVVNGLYDDVYDASVEYKLNRIALGTVDNQAAADFVGKDIESNNDSYGVWLAVGDMDNFYFYAEINDDDPINLGTATEYWNNDGMEIFIDIKDRRYEGGKRLGSEQHQLRLNIDADVATTKGVYSGPSFMNQATANDTIDMEFAIAPGTSGYTIEARIPWVVFFKTGANTVAEALAASKAANALYQGKPFAMELSVLDASAINVRKSILNWANNTGEDAAYNTNEFWGQVKLGSTGWAVGIRDQQAVSTVNVYPNPTNSDLTVDMANVASVEVYNLVGARVLSTQMVNTINVSSLEMGVYVVKATDLNGKVAVAKFSKN